MWWCWGGEREARWVADDRRVPKIGRDGSEDGVVAGGGEDDGGAVEGGGSERRSRHEASRTWNDGEDASFRFVLLLLLRRLLLLLSGGLSLFVRHVLIYKSVRTIKTGKNIKCMENVKYQ